MKISYFVACTLLAACSSGAGAGGGGGGGGVYVPPTTYDSGPSTFDSGGTIDTGAAVPDVATTACGNGKCDPGESTTSCPSDCQPAGPVCGNGTCEAGESNATCANDCSPAGPVCGNGTCEASESNATCANDCPPAGPVCGNGKCDTGESNATCAKDCPVSSGGNFCDTHCGKSNGSTTSACYCDATCQTSGDCCNANGTAPSGKSCGGSTCAACNGSTATTCPNGKCDVDVGETVQSCPQDCKTSGPKCGDGKCDAGESKTTCAADCSGCSPACGSNQVCIDGTCKGGCDLGLDYHGCCAGAVWVSCLNAKSTANDCSVLGQNCGWAGSYYTCGASSSSDPSGKYDMACKGSAAPVCGDGKCDPGESAANCVKDCLSSGSCAGKCGGNDGNCYCDNQCENKGNCCTDKLQQCGSCAKKCLGKACGDDGCGGLCGTCAANESCGPDSFCAAACTTNSTCTATQVCLASACAPAGGQFYQITVIDGTVPQFNNGKAWDSFGGALADPFVRIRVEGVLKCETPYVNDTTTPMWNGVCPAMQIGSTSNVEVAILDYDGALPNDSIDDAIWDGVQYSFVDVLHAGGINGAFSSAGTATIHLTIVPIAKPN